VKWLCDDRGEPIVSVIHRPAEEDVIDSNEKSEDQDYEQKELRYGSEN